MKRFAAVATLGLLAGCGGGKGLPSIDKSVDYGSDFGLASYLELEDQALLLSDAIVLTSPSATLPTSGMAGYAGVMIVAPDIDADEGLVGEMRLVADFGSERIDGKAVNFWYGEYDIDGNLIAAPQMREGTLYVASQGFDGAAFETMALEGDLEVNGALRDVSGTLVGGFMGTDGTYLIGLGEDVSVSGTANQGVYFIAGSTAP
jgi:hypothetical protein